MKYITVLGLILLSSCGIYNDHFDCPPGKGIGCASVNEVLDLIVEKREGEDVFVKDKGTALLLKQQEDKTLTRPPSSRTTYHLIQDETGTLRIAKLSPPKDS